MSPLPDDDDTSPTSREACSPDRSDPATLHLLEAIIDALPAMVFVKDAAELRFVLVNKTGEALIGHSRDQLIGKNDYDFFPQAEADFFTASDRNVLTTGRLLDIPEEPLQTAHHGVRLLHTRKVPIYGADGTPRYLLGISEDITERMRVESALAQSEACLKEAQHLAQLGSWELDLVNHRLRWSDEIFRLFEIDKTQFGASYEAFLNAVHPDDRTLVDTAYRRSVQGRTPYEITHRLLMADGRVKYVQERGQTQYSPSGIPLRSVGTVQDVSAQRRAEDALNQQQALLKGRLKEIHCLYGITRLASDDTLTVEQLAQEAAHLLPPAWRYPATTCARIRLHGQEFYTANFIATTWCQSAPIRLHGQEVGQIDVYYTAPRPPAYEGPFLKEERELIEAVAQRIGEALARHDAERERDRLMDALAEARDQALAATQAKSAFLASMSHEIRTPMNAIIGLAEVLQDSPLSQEQQEHVSRLSKAASGLLDLLNGILDLSKVESGHLELESIAFDLQALVQDIVELMTVRAQAKHLALSVFIHPDIVSWVQGDPTRLRQVLVNLTGNAIKFTEEGQVAITLEPAGPTRLRFTVSDTGIGIPADKLGTVFERFTQVDSSTTRKYGGTGLGLSISNRLVEKMGGRLSVESVEGMGSTFSFIVPMPAASAPAPGAFPSASPLVEPCRPTGIARPLPGAPTGTPQGDPIPSLPPTSTDRRLRILLVEDLEDNRAIVSLILKKEAIDLDIAEHGYEGLRKFKAGQFDLVLMDIQMPVMDGYAATAAIREWERTQHRPPTPILALTANAFREDAEKSLAAGCTAHLTKPIKKQTLLEAIRAHTRTVPDTSAA